MTAAEAILTALFFGVAGFGFSRLSQEMASWRWIPLPMARLLAGKPLSCAFCMPAWLSAPYLALTLLHGLHNAAGTLILSLIVPTAMAFGLLLHLLQAGLSKPASSSPPFPIFKMTKGRYKKKKEG